MSNEISHIELRQDFRGKDSTTFTGRPQGEQVREFLDLDSKDKDRLSYMVNVPVNTSAINPSFYLGLFFVSIKRLGGIAKFKEKYLIQFNETDTLLKAKLYENLRDCEREAQNEFEGKTGLDSFM